MGPQPEKQYPGVITNLLQKTGRGTSGAYQTIVALIFPRVERGGEDSRLTYKTIPRTHHQFETGRGAPGAY